MREVEPTPLPLGFLLLPPFPLGKVPRRRWCDDPADNGVRCCLLDLTVLHLDAPGVTPHQAGVMEEQAEVCLSYHKHAPGVLCSVQSERTGSKVPISWTTSEDQLRLQAAHGDLQEATEGGATGVAIAYMKYAHDLVVTGRSPKDGNGFDYFMAPKGAASIFRSKPTARLEVSGVLSNDSAECRSRLKQKIAQVKKNLPAGLDAFAVVVGFKHPSVWVESV